MTLGVAGPDRARQGVKQIAQGLELGLGALVALAQLRQFEPVAGDVADAQHRPAAHGAALGLVMAAREAGEGQTEAAAPAAQALDPMFQGLRRVRMEP